MTDVSITAPVAALRQATDADIDAVCEVWHRGWHDGHDGLVPPKLYRHRRAADFRRRYPARRQTTTVATVESAIVGFVTVHGDEIEQLYVDGPARGTGVAAMLLAHGETVIGERFDRAWLAVVAGNVRARRFYERNGWSDAGAIDNAAWTVKGDTITVPARRYEKRLRGDHRLTPSCCHPTSLIEDGSGRYRYELSR